jgi:hypothetical protein
MFNICNIIVLCGYKSKIILYINIMYWSMHYDPRRIVSKSALRNVILPHASESSKIQTPLIMIMK